MTRTEAEAKGFHGFNNGEHIPLVLDANEVTLTINRMGRKITVAFFGNTIDVREVGRNLNGVAVCDDMVGISCNKA